jgi:hypothetical protein
MSCFAENELPWPWVFAEETSFKSVSQKPIALAHDGIKK